MRVTMKHGLYIFNGKLFLLLKYYTTYEGALNGAKSLISGETMLPGAHKYINLQETMWKINGQGSSTNINF